MRHQAENKADNIIIGGGASGLAAACICAQYGQNTLLLEKENRVGRKLLATGNGRCNLLNTGDPVFFGDPDFALRVLNHCSAEEVKDFFFSLGLRIREEEDGRAYPLTNQAASVLDCLRAKAESSSHIRILSGVSVMDIKKSEEGFIVRTDEGNMYSASRLIVATGGPAAPKLGGSDLLIKPICAMGHRLIPQRPALSAIITDTEKIRGLSGLRVPAYLTLYNKNRWISASAGEALFTDYGVSGVCAMQLSRDAGDSLGLGQEKSLSLDFSPLMGLAPSLQRRLKQGEWEQNASRALILDLLTSRLKTLGAQRLYVGLLPRLLAQKVQGLSLNNAADWLSGLRLRVNGVTGYDQAQVTAGGLDCADFDPETLMSKQVPGLYVCGETLNVDGDCGGFNLLFAWATGILAARHACRAEA